MLGPVTFPLSLPALASPAQGSSHSPIFVRIADLVSAEIRRGRLRPGDRLPGTRRLAEQLAVGRNTVVAAYGELAAEGWIVTRAAGGSFVSSEVPELRARRYTERAKVLAAPTRPGFDFQTRTLMLSHRADPKVLALFAGVPDLRQFPSALLARAYRRALRGAGRAALDYTSPFGDPRLRAALASMVSATRGLSLSPEQLLVTHGSQMALDLLARTLVRPGDRVGVEQIGYQPAWAALEQAGAKLVYLPVDELGVNIDALASAFASGPLRAVCLTPHHQYPDHRRALGRAPAALARARGEAPLRDHRRRLRSRVSLRWQTACLAGERRPRGRRRVRRHVGQGLGAGLAAGLRRGAARR